MIAGAKIMIQKNTVGHAIKKRLNHKEIKFSPVNVIKIIHAETTVLVQNDIINAKTNNLIPVIYLI